MRHSAPVSASLSLIALFTFGSSSRRKPAAQTQTPSTRPERTAHRETSRYDDVMAFVREVDAKSPKIHVTSFGYTFEGKSLPLVVVGEGLADASADAVKKSGKTRVYIQGNIHGGEVEGKEAVQMLLRELSRGEHADWLQSLVLLFAPIYNADGNDRVRMSERNAQNGPIGGVGTRAERAGSRSQSRSHEAGVAGSAIADVDAEQPTIRIWRSICTRPTAAITRITSRIRCRSIRTPRRRSSTRCAANGCRRSRRRSRRRMAGTSTTTATSSPSRGGRRRRQVRG